MKHPFKIRDHTKEKINLLQQTYDYSNRKSPSQNIEMGTCEADNGNDVPSLELFDIIFLIQ